MDSHAQRAAVNEAIDALCDAHDPKTTPPKQFWAAQFDAGLAWVWFPEGAGGLGVSPELQHHVNRQIVARGGTVENRLTNILGIGMGAATILAHGTDTQIARYLKPMFTCEEIWCQLFSEPGAGSDLAALATSAVKDADWWVINGQKVWNTLAHVADFGLLVARTDPNVAKHAGLTYFILDMHQDGVDVRPLYQITSEAEFNEVYLTDVALDDTMRLGDVGAGWSVAMTTLANERVAIGGNAPARSEGIIAQAITAFRDARERGDTDPVLEDQLMAHWVEAETLRLTTLRANTASWTGTPGPEGSTSKLQWAELNKAVSSFTLELLGPAGVTYPRGYTFDRPTEPGLSSTDPHHAFLRSRANSIEGGTSEIMRNILGERVLKLPGEPRVDKDVAWRDVPRN